MEKSNSINYWKYYLLLLLLLAITFNVGIFSNSLKYTSNTEESLDKKTELFDLKNSGPQINITTPENKTYTRPMTGYYPATYGFENDKTGNVPYGWILENSGGTASIIDSIGDHKKVLQLYDNNGSSGVDLNNLFDSSQPSGTIEWWWRISDVIKISTFEIRDGSSLTITLFVRNSEFQYYSGGYLSVQSVSNDIWYHHRIDFNCSTDKFDWYINDVKKVDQGNFRTVATSVDRVFLHTHEVDSNFYNYFDAISYFWDTDYTIGDNLNGGLLLSFENSTNLEWMGYSIDGQINKTIIGNTTITFPTYDGLHTIQVFGNDSFGTNYQSDIRYFSIRMINLITPENKTYVAPMSGYYPAIYGFENDKEGSNPNGWNATEPASCFVDVIGEVGGHKKVVQITDNNPVGYPKLFKSISLTSGIVEFWIRAGETNRQHYISIVDASNNGVHFYMRNNGYWTYTTGVFHDIETYSANQWYLMKIEFDTNDFHVWINGVSKDGGSGFALAGSPTSFTNIAFNTDHGEDGGNIWLDAIGYSWDPNYNLGVNLDEGLLVSFDLGFNPVWLGYSLDGLTNKTILGNTTIPFLSEGVHTIQVFGKNSIGTLYQSDIRYFSIDINAPTSMISFTPYRDPNIVIKSTVFTITADDGLGSGVSLIRYKINDLSWNTYIGSFNLSTYEYDVYNITYQAIDGVGHIESENTITVTLIPEPSQPGIPGYHLVVMICIISIVSAVIIKKRFKSQF